MPKLQIFPHAFDWPCLSCYCIRKRERTECTNSSWGTPKVNSRCPLSKWNSSYHFKGRSTLGTSLCLAPPNFQICCCYWSATYFRTHPYILRLVYVFLPSRTATSQLHCFLNHYFYFSAILDCLVAPVIGRNLASRSFPASWLQIVYCSTALGFLLQPKRRLHPFDLAKYTARYLSAHLALARNPVLVLSLILILFWWLGRFAGNNTQPNYCWVADKPRVPQG